MKMTNLQRLVNPESLERVRSRFGSPEAPTEKPWLADLKKLIQPKEEQSMTQRTIDAALNQVQLIEGGYSDDPRDPGGPTNHGVTLKFLKQVRPGATLDDLKALTKDEARSLFREEFVMKPGIDRLPDRVQAEAIGLSINAGPSRAVKVLQAAAGVEADGKVGPKTIAALEKLSDAQVKAAVDDFYRDLVQRRPDLQPFLKGWLNRSAALASIPEDTTDGNV